MTNTISRKTLKLMPLVSIGGSIGGDIEGGESDGGQEGDYVDEYGINHGQGVKIGETVWAPVNCGYHATDFKYGKLYQWGRKYGQGYDGSLYDGNGSEIGKYSDLSIPELVEGPVSLSTGQSKSNQKYFYTSNYSSKYDWCSPQDDKLWNSGTEENPIKTEYDPCPKGWRVPTYAELDELSNNYSSWTSENNQNGRWFSGSESFSSTVPHVFLPAASYRGWSGGANLRGRNSYYWSSSPYYYSYGHAYCLGSYYYRDGVNMSYDTRADGYSVRCVQATDEVAEL